VIPVVISRERAVDDLRAKRADRVSDRASECWFVQRDRTVRETQEAVIESEKVSNTLGLALSRDIHGWRVKRDKEREHLAPKTLMEGKVAADCDDLVIGMGSHDQHALLLNRTKLDRHAVGEAVNAAKETRRSTLKYTVEE
jgi:hypothetical protein